MKKAAVALAVFLSACGSHSSEPAEFQTGRPIIWPAPNPDNLPTPTTDPNQDYGIWGPPRASANNPNPNR